MTDNQLKVALKCIGQLYLDAHKSEMAAIADQTRYYYRTRKHALRNACQMIRFARASYFATVYA